MEARIVFWMTLVETILIGGVFLLYPKIVRKGLLFGVYVGERAFDGEEARAITRRWYAGMLAALAGSLVAALLLGAFTDNPLFSLVPLFLMVLAFLGFYLRAYRQARGLARDVPPPAAVAPLECAPSPHTALPAAAVGLALACGLLAVGYAALQYDGLPARIPTHFGLSGAPDAWTAKSPASVLLLPILSLVTTLFTSVIAWLTAHAKRALRHPDLGVSLEAQLRFRTAMARFLSVVSILLALALTVMSVSSIRVGLGIDARLHPVGMVLMGLLVAWALGGILYIALRYGQGGARLERAGADAPLTDGLADNRRWVLGMFYVNREDPSFLVEHRFGIGYTLNFGNPKAVALFVGSMVVILGLILVAVLTS